MASTTKQEPATFGTAKEEDEAFDKVTQKGREGGLFRACMKAIRSAHFRSNRVRAILVVAGLFTDKLMYREVISIFYAVTREVELALKREEKKGDVISKKLLSLGYKFTPQYEKDLALLYDGSSDWKEQVEATVNKTKAAVEYCDKIKNMKTGAELAGAAFVLWGALIIGGGAIAAPRVEKRGWPTHLFQDVTGPGREERKRKFVQVWDSLATAPLPPDSSASSSEEEFDEIVRQSQECMQCNNNVLSSLNRNPWWLPYTISVGVGVASILIVLLRRHWTKG